MTVKLELEKVSEHTVATKPSSALHSIAGAVAFPEYVIAFDPTMFPKTTDLFRKKVEDYFGLPLKYLLLSHYHADHVFGLKHFRDITIISPNDLLINFKKSLEQEYTEDYIEEWKQEAPELAPWIEEIEFVFPNLLFQNKIILNEDKFQLDFERVGGHTNCSSYAYFPKEQILFAGDLIFSKQLLYVGDQSSNPDVWIEILDQFSKMDIKKVIPGHGPVCDKEMIKEQLDYLRKLRNIITKAIQEDRSQDEIEIPDYYDTEYEQLMNRNLEHLFKFYREKSN